MPAYLFAYGTLRPDLAPPALRPAVDTMTLLDAGRTPGRLYDVGSFPAATFGGGGFVHGHVFALPADDAAVLHAFDAYEGVPDLYIRTTVTVTLAGGGEQTCWAYQYNREGAPLRPIPSGVYTPEHRPEHRP